MASAGGGATAGAAAAAAAEAARKRRIKIIMEVMEYMEPIKCPQCKVGTLLPLFTSGSTNWVCSQPECAYIVHQHGSKSAKVWKGEAGRDDGDSRGTWFETP
ncbi:MAG: hypothetical protein KAT58_02290 [candidate division Zixibacteria bacterium]|nr:hypothetical protein [candidate division Zixibacteria bacterium]